MARPRNLFISHSWSYSNAYARFCDLLDAAPRFSYRNYSVPRESPVHNAPNTQALYNAIFARMRFCEVVIIMAGKYATYSKWIVREVRIANREFTQPKPILAVRPWANEQVSSVVADAADLLVSWSTASVVRAIRDLAP
jgi:hypothetical protein